MGFLVRIREGIKVIQSAFNAVMCIYFEGTFHFRGVFSKQIYLTDRAMKSVKMVEHFIEISVYFYLRCSKINSSTE